MVCALLHMVPGDNLHKSLFIHPLALVQGNSALQIRLRISNGVLGMGWGLLTAGSEAMRK